jgi:hypothetical protein
VRSVGGYWQPKYSVPNARMVEAVQMLARTEGIPLDPVCRRRSKSEPPCRPNIEPGAQASFSIAGCG